MEEQEHLIRFPDVDMNWVTNPYDNSESLQIRTTIRTPLKGDGLFKDTWYVMNLTGQYQLSRRLNINKDKVAFEFIQKFLKEAYEYSKVESPNEFIMDLAHGDARIWQKDPDQRSESERLIALKQKT